MNSARVVSAGVIQTKFADPYREDRESVMRRHRTVSTSPNIGSILNAVPYITLILNCYRQIIFGNRTFEEMLSISDPGAIIGMRPGEVLQCIHSTTEPGGCGTAESCRVCGAVNAVLECLEKGRTTHNDAGICVKNGEYTTDLDLSITANPFSFREERYVIVTIVDVSDEKRRKALERIFLHDIANVVGGIVGMSELLQFMAPAEITGEIDTLNTATRQLFDELQAQQYLLRAENNELSVKIGRISSRKIVDDVADLFRDAFMYPAGQVIVDPGSQEVVFSNDRTLLFRVLTNMVKNAIEASTMGEKVTIGVYEEENEVVFFVHNHGFIPSDVQLKVFQRSFSTKGAGRGLGTYSMKLLSERYLNGRVFFNSTKEDGTSFYAAYPLYGDDCTETEEERNVAEVMA